MESPLIIALARQISVRDQMSVTANNIANMSTPAYKAERLMFHEYIARTASGQNIHFPQKTGLHRTNELGPISKTSNSLDLALRGDGYFVLETPQGIRYTRNGHMSLDAEGRLVTSRGDVVLNTSDRPIVFDSSAQEITVAKDGSITADGQSLGRIKVVRFENPQVLERLGGNRFTAKVAPVPTEETQVLQGHIEGSNVEPILEITRFMNSVGSYQSAKEVIEREGERQRRAIERLGSLPQ